MLTTDQEQAIQQLVNTVGIFQLKEQSKVKTIQVAEKSLNQLVSYVDTESEKMLVAGLQKITPSAGYLTEEETTTIKNDQLYWIIDPIDGTTNYLFDHTKFSISLALYKEGSPIYACVHIPADAETFKANPIGAFLNDKLFSCSERIELKDTLIATGFPYYNFSEMNEYLSVLQELMKRTKGVRRMGSAAIDLAYTAYGRFDAFYELNLSPWDVAGGAYIVQQAGGNVSDFSNGNNFVFGNTILAGNPSIHSQLLELIAKENF
ncbi:MAG: inositol monophosphatase [Bacteroidetes bacterium]|nr:MAG: inositol monophosphatase [Bacteroidota bacterium]